MSENDGLGAIGTGGDDIDRHSRQLLHARQVTSGILREARKLGKAGGRLAPAGQRLVDRHHFRVTMRQKRRVLADLAVDAVARADADRVEPVEHVELGDTEAREAVVQHSATKRDGVEPAAAPRPTRDRAKLVPDAREMLTHLVEELGWERARANARGVGLHDAEHGVDVPRTEASADGRLPRDRVRRGDERIGADVYVEQCALRPFEKQVSAGPHLGTEPFAYVFDQRQQPLALREAVLERALKLDGLHAEVALQHEVVEVEHLAESGCEAIALEQIRDAHRAPRDLVLVGRTDTAAGRADRIGAACALARAVERDVRRQNQRAVGAHPQTLIDRHALLHQRIRLPEERFEREHYTVADQAMHTRMQNAGRYQRQDRPRAVDHQRVSGVVAALEADNGGDALRQKIDDLALALVAPLRADDHQVPGHGRRSGFRQPDPRTTYRRTAPAIMLANPAARRVRSSSLPT